MGVRSVKPRQDQNASRYHVDLVSRTVDALKYLASRDRPATLAELTTDLGWSKATVYRMIRTLETVGAVRQVDGSGYTLGPAMIPVGEAALRALKLPDLARPHLQWLHDAVHETSNLAVLEDREILIVARVEDRQILGIRLDVGSRLHAYCTSVGHVLLAGLSDAEIARRYEGETFAAHGPQTVSSLRGLLDRLADVREQGFALNDEELAIGHRAVAAPVLDWNSNVVAAINVSVPAARISSEEMRERVVPLVREAARSIGRSLTGAMEAEDVAG
jgi:IclR family pca regulon transcriptional regulator